MNFDPNVWQTPLVVLGLGLALGAALLMQRRRDPDGVTAEGRRRDLEREHEAALEALRALETEQDKMDPEIYAQERKALLARGAASLRALEGQGAAPTATGAPVDLDALVRVLRDERARVGDDAFAAALRVATGHAAPESAQGGMSPAWRGAFYATGVWALIAVLVFYAGDQSHTRRDGGSMTGGTVAQGNGPPMAPPRGGPDFDQLAAPLEARLAANPNDLGVLNELTQLALSAGDAQRAMEYSQKASAIDANDPDVLASKAVLAAMVGLTDRAHGLLDQALAASPEHARSVTYKGLLLLEDGKPEQAVPYLEKAVALQPGVVPLQQALDAARRGDRMPSAPAGPPPGPAPAPASGGDVVVSGTVYLGPGAAADGAQVVFVSLRAPEGGPPLAALQLPVTGFPMDFTVTTANAIAMGGAPRPFPPMMSLSVRLDGDGNAMTREALPQGGEGGVAKGTTGLRITLQ